MPNFVLRAEKIGIYCDQCDKLRSKKHAEACFSRSCRQSAIK